MTSRFLYYLYSRQLCSYGITIILHYLKDDEDMFWLMIPEDAIHKMESVSHESKFDRQFIPDVVKEICSELKHLKYVKSAVSAYRRAIELLYLFLDMKDIEYSSEAMWIWFECVRPHFSKEGRSERRALQILYMKLNGIEVHYERLFRYMPRKIDLLPDWCHNTVTDFLKMKEAEGLKYNTVAMYRSAIFRFCMYLESMGVHSFNEITAVQIKSFNLNDKHKTSESKNAYNVRIRKFLKHLCLEGVISNTHLYFAVPCCSTSRETVVITLTEEEKAELSNAMKSDDLSLRDKAVLALGHRLGIRSSDIANLEVSSIHWDRSSIQFVQSKTGVEIILPLPTDVGNALYRYLTDERPDTDTSKIFVRHRAPYSSAGRSICQKAFYKALPDRNVEGSGFHVLRKTMATGLLQSGSNMNEVSEVLGHSNNATVMTYLSLDCERMKKCTISLADSGLLPDGGSLHV